MSFLFLVIARVAIRIQTITKIYFRFPFWPSQPDFCKSKWEGDLTKTLVSNLTYSLIYFNNVPDK